MMVVRRFFPEITLDNDENYLKHLEAVIESIDEYAEMEVTKGTDSYHFRIISSLPKYNTPLLHEILKFNNQYGIHLDLSKSIKSSGTLAFNIKL